MPAGWASVRALSAYPRAQEHLTERTSTGALVTVVGVLVAAVLFAHETSEAFHSSNRVETRMVRGRAAARGGGARAPTADLTGLGARKHHAHDRTSTKRSTRSCASA